MDKVDTSKVRSHRCLLLRIDRNSPQFLDVSTELLLQLRSGDAIKDDKGDGQSKNFLTHNKKILRHY